jgi:hypothetical protein
MPDDTILCWRSNLTPTRHITVADYKAWVAEGEGGKKKIARFFADRLTERYVDPVTHLEARWKNGFSFMAVSCLLIETLETFYQGWESTEPTKTQRGRSKLAFRLFFNHQREFEPFRSHADKFWKHVRCGILHQGETSGGWIVGRHGSLFNKADLEVNATKFHRALSRVIRDYSQQLQKEPLSADIWQKFKTKMNAIIKNCEP